MLTTPKSTDEPKLKPYITIESSSTAHAQREGRICVWALDLDSGFIEREGVNRMGNLAIQRQIQRGCV